MTELQTFISWLERQNISFDKVEGEKFTFVSVERGYVGFRSNLLFNREGKFVDIEADE
jgi:hypothetical protein